MQKRLLIKVVCLFINYTMILNVKNGTGSANPDKTYKYIMPMDLADINAHRPKEVSERCSFDVLNAYSLYADAPTLGFKNSICPKLTQNCCGPRDMRKISELWEKDQKRIQAHNIVYLKTLRYLIGYGNEYYILAKKMRKIYEKTNESNQVGRLKKDIKAEGEKTQFSNITNECYKGAVAVTRINYDKLPKASILYDMLNDRARFLHALRHKFYCMLCSPTPLKDGKVSNDFVTVYKKKKRVRYPKDMCHKLATNTVHVSYELYHNYSVFLQNVIQFSRCIDLKENKFDINSKNFINFSKNPLNINDKNKVNNIKDCHESLSKKYHIKECKGYCKSFNIAAPTTIYDGDVKRLMEVHDYLEQLEPFMKSPGINMFRDDMPKLKTDISDYEKHTEEYFYKSINPEINLAEYRSKIIYNDKADIEFTNPLIVGDKTRLDFKYKSYQIVLAVIVFVMTIVIL